MTKPQGASANKADHIPEHFVEFADSMIHRGEYLEAEQLLTKAVALMPCDWKPATETADFLKIAFWNTSEFETYVEFHRAEPGGKSLMWTYPSYSKAYFLLAYLAAERKDFDQALDAVSKGLDLEPDHPKMLCEKGFLLRHLNRPEEALETYQRAASARALTPLLVKADSLRGQGFALLDLNRLAEAEKVLKDSLALEPNSDAATDALDYISEIQSSELARQEEHGSPQYTEQEIAEKLKDMAQYIDEMEAETNKDERWKAARVNDPLYQRTTYEERKANRLAAFEAFLRKGEEGIREHLNRVNKDSKITQEQSSSTD
jgi:tetratricopeptide (TPR) repeat protein